MIVQTKQQGKKKVETLVTDLVIDIENEKRARKLKKHWLKKLMFSAFCLLMPP
jgi:hypothetical protein